VLYYVKKGNPIKEGVPEEESTGEKSMQKEGEGAKAP